MHSAQAVPTFEATFGEQGSTLLDRPTLREALRLSRTAFGGARLNPSGRPTWEIVRGAKLDPTRKIPGSETEPPGFSGVETLESQTVKPLSGTVLPVGKGFGAFPLKPVATLCQDFATLEQHFAKGDYRHRPRGRDHANETQPLKSHSRPSRVAERLLPSSLYASARSHSEASPQEQTADRTSRSLPLPPPTGVFRPGPTRLRTLHHRLPSTPADPRSSRSPRQRYFLPPAPTLRRMREVETDDWRPRDACPSPVAHSTRKLPSGPTHQVPLLTARPSESLNRPCGLVSDSRLNEVPPRSSNALSKRLCHRQGQLARLHTSRERAAADAQFIGRFHPAQFPRQVAQQRSRLHTPTAFLSKSPITGCQRPAHVRLPVGGSPSKDRCPLFRADPSILPSPLVADSVHRLWNSHIHIHTAKSHRPGTPVRLYLPAHGYDRLSAKSLFFHTRLPHATVSRTPTTPRPGSLGIPLTRG